MLIDKAVGLVYIGEVPDRVLLNVPVLLVIEGEGSVKSGAPGEAGGIDEIIRLDIVPAKEANVSSEIAVGLVYIGAFPDSVFANDAEVALAIAGVGVVKSGTAGGTGGAVDMLKSPTVNAARFQNKVESSNPITAPLLYTGGVDIPRIAPALAFVTADTSRAVLGPE